jgi:uncharacterized membrane protein YfcA
MIDIIISASAGVAAGVVNGFIGTGGGIILTFIFIKIMGKDRTKDAFATVITAILPISFVSAVNYHMNGNLRLDETLVYIIPAVIGGFAGAFLLEKIKVDWLKIIFSALVVYAGVRMLVK